MVRVVLEGFERHFVFRLTRFITMAAIFVLSLGLIAAGVWLGLSFRANSSSVSPQEVVVAITPPPTAEPGGQAQPGNSLSTGLDSKRSSLKIPFVLQKHLSDPHNLEIVKGWLVGLSDDEKTQYLDEMAQAVEAAEKENLDPHAAINKFHELKSEKQALSQKMTEQRNLYLSWYASASATALNLIALLVLALVLLAVERNTRRVDSP